MDRLTSLYSKLLQFGFLAIQEAVDSKDLDWANAEVELLHNIPSLLDEPNHARHQYFWFTEREHYRQWARAAARDRPLARMRMFYEPIWAEMESILLELLSHCPEKGIGNEALAKHH